ncbi:hypothetical protein MKW98_007346 [Papaver atlanticum]|uniref:Malectin-like domain-containing protein n=1 Tax=Papaver atlanticum TaxID=357466 RepID=A0AAD4XCS5_9MAGN|nr:hypothetical protein MKW98_007346 [Papaver atlanticum]
MSSPFVSLLVFVFLCLLFTTIPINCQHPPPQGTFIDCGATNTNTSGFQEWELDFNFISSGVPKTLNPIPDFLPKHLQTLRSFPLGDGSRKKFCYVVPAVPRAKYLIRSSYFYGGINGNDFPVPPVFDQIIDGTIWGIVNTTDDFYNGVPSYYEGVFVARVKAISVCVAINTYTELDPFINALELIRLDDSVYNTTDFANFGLSLVARNSFGYPQTLIRYPDDPFDRMWKPSGESYSTPKSVKDIDVSGFWNLPPLSVFETALTTEQENPVNLDLQWPTISLPNSTYYIALYFADGRNSSSRVFNITINGIQYYQNLNATTAGAVVFASRWPLSGRNTISLIPVEGSVVGSSINAGEIFNLLALGGRTLIRDLTAMENLKNGFDNPPIDWNGDPCIPPEHAWTGVVCSAGPRVRVVSLNLTSMALSGYISRHISNMTALTDIWLGNNSLTGTIPNLEKLQLLKTLHLEDNQLDGYIPSSLGKIGSLRELFLQNNNLMGQIPRTLLEKRDLNLKTSPGNILLQPPSPS